MPPTTPPDFLKAALQRLTTAEALLEILRITLESQYLGGYTVECALKALILEKMVPADRPTTLRQLTHGATWHRPEVLLGTLKALGMSLTPELARRMRKFDWTTDLRYETGRRDTGETRAFLRTARSIYEWVEGQIT